MTMIGFATYGDSAELVVDTAAFSPHMRHVATTTKFLTLHHLSAWVITGGDQGFGLNAKLTLVDNAHTTFDDLVAETPEALRWVWEKTNFRDTKDPDGQVYLVGYSESAGAFTAHRFLKDHDFEPEHVENGFHIQPAAITFRPNDAELDELRRNFPDLSDFIEEWALESPPNKPQGEAEWIDLVLEIRHGRSAIRPSLKVLVAGSAIWTRMTREASMTIKMMDFNDHGAELEKIVAGTLHPRAQVGPCDECDSGRPLMDCCLQTDIPCPCGNAEATLAECCLLTPADREEWAHRETLFTEGPYVPSAS
jgi:hypothetical protein